MRRRLYWTVGTLVAAWTLAACPSGGKKGKGSTTPPPRAGLPGESEQPGEEPGMGQVVSKPKVKLTAKEKQSYEKALATYEKLAKQAAKTGWKESMCEKAASTFAAVARDNPKLEPFAKHNQGVIWLKCGKIGRARSIFEEIIAKDRNFAPTLVSLGYLAFKSGDRAKAFRLFERAYLADPRCAEASFNLGVCYRTKGKQGSLSDAERQRLRSLRFVAGGYPAYATWMAKLENQGQTIDYFDLAIRHLQTVLAITSGSEDPDSKVMNLRAYALLALVYTDASEKMSSKLTLATLVVNEANNVIKEYKEPLCRGGDHVTPMDKAVAELRNVDGLIELKKKHLVEAMKRFTAAVQCWPRFKEAHMNIGAIALSFRGYKRARDSFLAVLREDPKNLDAIMGLGVAYRGMSAEAMADEKDKLLNMAEAQYKKVMALAPSNSKPYADALYNLGLLYQDYKTGNSDEENRQRLLTAMSYYDKYLAHPKSIPSARKDALQRKGDIKRTLEIMKQMAELKRQEEERARRFKEQQRQQQQQGGKPGQKGQTPARQGGK